MSRRILIVEDEALIALDLEDALMSAGFQVAGIAKSIEEALVLVDEGGFDVAVIDAFLSGNSSAPVATTLEALHVPFVVVSGYDAKNLGWGSGAPFVGKPYNYTALCSILDQMCKSRG